MRTLQYTIRFLTPAFLGDARQSGRWRTPPLKAQLRQWWRVAYAADKQFAVNVNEMRQAEGELFGFAGDDGQKEAAQKSALRLRLGKWAVGKMQNNWEYGDTKIHHPEAEPARYRVGALAYLGYGPLDGRGGTKFRKETKAAIQAGEHSTLRIAVPDEHVKRISHALWLMHRFGTVGGRSRNGWGSYTLEPFQQGATDTAGGWNNTPALPLRLWTECLNLDWAHALGKDNTGALIWQTQAHADWQSLMQELATIKIGLRTKDSHIENPNPNTFSLKPNPARGDIELQNNRGVKHGTPAPRHWLSYPVTKHSVTAWGGNARLPNSLRFKVCPDPEDNEKLRGIIFHVPCLPPEKPFNPDRNEVERVWRQVHRWLDNSDFKLKRLSC